MGIISIIREQQIFVVKESTKGTLVFPSAAAQMVIAAGPGSINQQPTYTPSPEIVNSRDLINEFVDQMPAGEWSFAILARPDGDAGDAPMGDALFESLLGTKTVNSGVSVVYTPGLTKPSLSIWVVGTHSIFFCKGATVGTAKLAISNKGGMQWDLSGGFMHMGWVGTDSLAVAALQTDTAITVYDSKKYCVGGKIKIASDDNSGAGYLITAVNYTAHVLTISPGLASGHSKDEAVTPFMISGSAVGTPIHNRTAALSIASVNVPLQTAEITIEDAPKYLDDELTVDDYPTDYIENERNISGRMSVYFRKDDLKYLYDGAQAGTQELIISGGSGAGCRQQVKCPYTKVKVPKTTPNAPAINLDIDFRALGSAGEDSVEIKFY